MSAAAFGTPSPVVRSQSTFAPVPLPPATTSPKASGHATAGAGRPQQHTGRRQGRLVRDRP
jgi:hypothetical protein